MKNFVPRKEYRLCFHLYKYIGQFKFHRVRLLIRLVYADGTWEKCNRDDLYFRYATKLDRLWVALGDWYFTRKYGDAK
jgi:hypothetical protein